MVLEDCLEEKNDISGSLLALTFPDLSGVCFGDNISMCWEAGLRRGSGS
jgi:hypothetical protein